MSKKNEQPDEIITQEVTVDGEQIILDNITWHPGAEKKPQDPTERLVRKALKLPITKQLVYYPNTFEKKTFNIVRYRLNEFYDVSDKWYFVHVELENGEIVNIHNAFLSEMQSPSFIEDINKVPDENSEE